MKRALILGCSHAAGTSISSEPGLDIDLSESQEYGAVRSYPVKIAQRLGYQPMNHAIAGGSNDAMFRIWHDHKNGLYQHDIVIACWTAYNRTELWDESENRWIAITKGTTDHWQKRPSTVLLEGVSVGGRVKHADQYEQYLKHWVAWGYSEEAGNLNKIKNIQALNSQAQQLGIRVINIHSIQPVWNLEQNSSWPVDVSFDDWAAEQGSARSACCHYFESTHSAFADYVLARLR